MEGEMRWWSIKNVTVALRSDFSRSVARRTTPASLWLVPSSLLAAPETI